MTRPSTPGATRLLLVRHGEVEDGARGRIYGRLEVALSAAGRAQASAAAARVAAEGPSALYASPALRARETAAPIAGALGLDVRTEARLHEIDFGRLEGLSFEEAERREPEAWRAWMERPGEVRFPGGESWCEVRARALAAAEALARAHAGAAVAAVTHGGIVRALVAAAVGASADGAFRIDVGFGSLTVLRREPFGWMVESANGRR